VSGVSRPRFLTFIIAKRIVDWFRSQVRSGGSRAPSYFDLSKALVSSDDSILSSYSLRVVTTVPCGLPTCAVQGDKHRTLQTPASRALVGRSMGGNGALGLAVKHPEMYGAVYALYTCCMTLDRRVFPQRSSMDYHPRDAID
jgi:hypothetical protein